MIIGRHFLLVSYLFSFASLIISCNSKTQEKIYPNSTDTETKSAGTPAKANNLPIDTNIIFLSAVDLTAEYLANEVKADHDYKGKEIIVTGVVADIKKGIGGDIFVILEGSEKFRAVQCYYDDEDDAQSLKKGMKVYFQGKCDGLWANVILKDCIRVGEFIR